QISFCLRASKETCSTKAIPPIIERQNRKSVEPAACNEEIEVSLGFKRRCRTVELTRRRESKHPPPHQVSCETRSRRSRPTICWTTSAIERALKRKIVNDRSGEEGRASCRLRRYTL